MGPAVDLLRLFFFRAQRGCFPAADDPMAGVESRSELLSGASVYIPKLLRRNIG